MTFNVLIFPLAFPSYQCPSWHWFRQGLSPVWCWSCTSTWRASTVHQSSANCSGKMPAPSHGNTWGTSTAELLQWIWLADWSPNSKVFGFRISKHQNRIEFLVSHVPVTAFQRTPQCSDLAMLCCSSSCMVISVISMIWLMFHPHPTYLQTIWKWGSFSLAWLPLIATVMAPSKNLSSLATGWTQGIPKFQEFANLIIILTCSLKLPEIIINYTVFRHFRYYLFLLWQTISPFPTWA